MALDFPSNPQQNDIYTEGNRSWTWNGRFWQATSVTTGYAGSVGYTGSHGDLGYTGSKGEGYAGSIGDTGFTGSTGYTGSLGESSFTWGTTPPSNPEIGDRWYDTTDGILLTYVDDGDSQQWVEVYASGFVGGLGYTGSQGAEIWVGPSPPLNAVYGDQWYDTNAGRLLFYYNDGTSLQWVELASSSVGFTGSFGNTGYTGSEGGAGYAGSVGYTGSVGSYVKTYFWEGALQENISVQRYYVHAVSELHTINVNVGEPGLTTGTIAVKKNGTTLNTISIPANTSYVTTSVNHSLAINDYITVDITQSSSAANLYVTLVYREQ